MFINFLCFFFAKSSCFSLQDLFAIDEFSVLRCGYFAVNIFEVPVNCSWHNPSAVRLIAVGVITRVIGFTNFGKEEWETFVQFFSLVFGNVVVEALAFCPLVLTVFLFTALLASFCIFSPEISGILPPFYENVNKSVIVVVMETLLYHAFLLILCYTTI